MNGVGKPMDLIEIMFNEERLTKNSIFSKKARVANFLLKFALVGLCLAFVSCANIFQDKVAMSRSGTSATLDSFFVGGAVVGKLNKPSEINVSQYEYKDKIRVSWSPVKNASYYILKRAVVEKDADGKWKKMKDDDSLNWELVKRIYITSYEDIIITKEWSNDDKLDYNNEKYKKAYYYSVSAGNELLGYDDSDEEKSTWGALLSPPTETRASLGSSEEHIKIIWKPSDGVRRYEVYRSSQTDGTNSTKIAELFPTETSYQDNNVSSFKGANLFYTVCAVGFNDTSVPSSVAMGYTSRPGAPKGVENVNVTKGHGESKDSIEIQWSAVDGGEISYNIYRSSSNDNTLVELATVSGDKTAYTDNGGKEKFNQNVYYYYYVQSYKKAMESGEEVIYQGPMSNSGPSSDLDEAYSEKYAEGFILSAPSFVEVQKPDIDKKNDPYTILFTPSIGDKNFPQGAKGEVYTNDYTYIVYGDASENGSFIKVEHGGPDFDKEKGKYSISVPKYKFYKMQVNFEGQKSDETEVVAPAPYAPTDVYVTCAALVGDYSNYQPDSSISTKKVEKDPGSNNNGVHPVKIIWKAPEGDDASCYNIYRKENINGSWGTPINAEPVTETYYIDKNENAKIGTVYYYSVISLNSLKQGANMSTFIEPTIGKDGIIETTYIDIDGKSIRCGRGWGWGALSAWQYMREERKTIESSQKKLSKMNVSSDTDKIGTCYGTGAFGGTVHYETSAKTLIQAASGLKIYITYTNYVDFYIQNKPELGAYFKFDGSTNTNISSVTSQGGNMFGTLNIEGMYPGKVLYDNVIIKGGAAAGGTYGVIRDGIDTESNHPEVFYTSGDK